MDETSALLLPPSDDSFSASRSPDQTRYRVYRRRWFFLATVCILNLSNTMIWISFSPVADKTAAFYNIGTDSVNWLALAYPVASIPFGFLAAWLLDTWGLRVGIILASWANSIGAVLRLLSGLSIVPMQYKFAIVLTGQCISACAQPIVMTATTKVAALWFGEHQRTIANTIGSMSNPLGILITNILSPRIVRESTSLPLLLEIGVGPACLATLMATFGIWSGVPPTPPSASAEEETQPFFTGLKHILRNKSYLVLAFVFGTGMGVLTSLTTLMEQILQPNGYSDDYVGIAGAILIGAGIVGAGLAGLFVDKTGKFEESAKTSLSFASLALIAFMLASRYSGIETSVAIILGLYGFFGFAAYPVALELGVESTFPVAEATSSGFLIIMGQVMSIVLILLMQFLAQPLGSSTGLSLKDYNRANILTSAVLTFACVLFVGFYRCSYRRLHAEREVAAERILNYGSRHGNIRA